MLPLLRLAADGNTHRLSDAISALATEFNLTDAERAELLPSGKQTRFANRVGWTRTHLSKAGVLESVGHGVFRITDRGRSILKEAPGVLNVGYLERFPEYIAFKTASSKSSASPAATATPVANQTPEEVIAAGYQEYVRALSEELLQEVKSRSPEFFESLVVDLLVSMGYGGTIEEAGQSIGRSGDGGIDGIIKEDKLGLDIVYVQAKRWEGTVGRPVVQAFAGSLEGQRARKGVLITTSSFSSDARDYVTRIKKKIVLIDGQQLVEYMLANNVGVAEVERYSIKRIALDDLDYAADSRISIPIVSPTVD